MMHKGHHHTHASYDPILNYKSRAPLADDFAILRKELPALLPILEAQKDWYGSIYLERRSQQQHMANLKQTQIADQVNVGIVLRIYDGYTLYEEATDDLDIEKLKTMAKALAKRVGATRPTEGLVRRPYVPPTWAERLSAELEHEIVDQIPAGAGPKTPVHFGIRFGEDPRLVSGASTLARLKDLVERCRKLASQAELDPASLSYVMARQTFVTEEAVFIDRQTDMSQAIFRLSLILITMSGADRTYHRVGGLGGLEAVALKDNDILELLHNLKALKHAERLTPGKYRILFGPGVTGVLAHEAFGHSQEGDTCARGRSKAWELHKQNARVGNEQATILNNPAIFQNATDPCGAWGSYFFDEEGWLAQEQVLLDKGFLKPPMTNLTSAIRLGVPRTANGKRESWANGVYTRQTNTYFSPGDKTLDQLMQMLGDGYVVESVAGGMEDPKGMGIQVGLAFLKEVRGGKWTGRVFKGPAGGDIQMTGYTPDVLDSIVAKSKIEFDSSAPDRVHYPFNEVGGCGKYHKEFVAAGCGGPYVLLENVILG